MASGRLPDRDRSGADELTKQCDVEAGTGRGTSTDADKKNLKKVLINHEDE